MSTTAVILRDDRSLSITISPAAEQAKEQALMAAAFVVQVVNPASQETAVAAQADIHRLLALVEEDRKEVKAPVLQYGRAIDDAAFVFSQELKQEQLRLAQLIGNFQEQENARARAAQQAENERLTALEREKAALLAKATTEAQVDKIQEQFNLRAQQESVPVPQRARVEGQRVTEDWEITVVDIWALARAHPMAVKVEPRLSEIKTLLNAGVKVAGVTVKRVVKSTVRTTNEKH